MIKLGSSDIKDIRLGSTSISGIYLGNTLIYPILDNELDVGQFLYHDGTFSSRYQTGKELLGIIYMKSLTVVDNSYALYYSILRPAPSPKMGYWGSPETPGPSSLFSVPYFPTVSAALEDTFEFNGVNMPMANLGLTLVAVNKYANANWEAYWDTNGSNPTQPDSYPVYGVPYKDIGERSITVSGKSETFRFRPPTLYELKQLNANLDLVKQALSRLPADAGYNRGMFDDPGSFWSATSMSASEAYAVTIPSDDFESETMPEIKRVSASKILPTAGFYGNVTEILGVL